MELRLQSRTTQRAIGKIGDRDRTQLAVMAMAYGLIDPMARSKTLSIHTLRQDH